MASRKREPKTIQEALPLMQQLIRDGECLWIEAQWYHSTDGGRATSAVEYSCFAMVHDALETSAASFKIRAKADTPAKLVRAFAAELQKPRSRELTVIDVVTPVPARQAGTSRKPAGRLTQHRPLLTAGGGS